MSAHEDDGLPSDLWNEAYRAVGPSRDDMWDWLEAKYLALLEQAAQAREEVSPTSESRHP